MLAWIFAHTVGSLIAFGAVFGLQMSMVMQPHGVIITTVYIAIIASVVGIGWGFIIGRAFYGRRARHHSTGN